MLAMSAIAKMRAVVLDCPDPRALAEFYRALVGGDITYADDDWVNLRDGANVLLSFQRAPDYRAPDWPRAEHGQQFHIDVTVDDVNQAEPQVLALGARRTELQPGIDEDSNWRGLLRPRRTPLLPLLGLTPGLVPRLARNSDGGAFVASHAQRNAVWCSSRLVAADRRDALRSDLTRGGSASCGDVRAPPGTVSTMAPTGVDRPV